jgi:hypothetical protein
MDKGLVREDCDRANLCTSAFHSSTLNENRRAARSDEIKGRFKANGRSPNRMENRLGTCAADGISCGAQSVR